MILHDNKSQNQLKGNEVWGKKKGQNTFEYKYNTHEETEQTWYSFTFSGRQSLQRNGLKCVVLSRHCHVILFILLFFINVSFTLFFSKQNYVAIYTRGTTKKNSQSEPQICFQRRNICIYNIRCYTHLTIKSARKFEGRYFLNQKQQP